MSNKTIALTLKGCAETEFSVEDCADENGNLYDKKQIFTNGYIKGYNAAREAIIRLVDKEFSNS